MSPSTIEVSHLGRGPRRTYRHLHHQRGIVGNFRVRLIEGRDLRRSHWCALGLGPVRSLGLSRSHGEVSSFGTLRLGFWRDGDDDDDDDYDDDDDDEEEEEEDDDRAGKKDVWEGPTTKQTTTTTSTRTTGCGSATVPAFMPSMPTIASPPHPTSSSSSSSSSSTSLDVDVNDASYSKRPTYSSSSTSNALLPFDMGSSLRSATPSRSPYFPSYASTTTAASSSSSSGQLPPPAGEGKIPPSSYSHSSFSSSVERFGRGHIDDHGMKIPSAAESRPTTSLPVIPPPPPIPPKPDKPSRDGGSMGSKRGMRTNGGTTTTTTSHRSRNPRPRGPNPAGHYARDSYKTATVRNDSNPIWDEHDDVPSTRGGVMGVGGGRRASGDVGGMRNALRLPLRKDDLSPPPPSMNVDHDIVRLEVRLDEEMSPAESILVGGALSTAVGAAAAGASVVGMGCLARDASNAGMEMLGLGTDRLIGRGYVDLTPLLLGAWEEVWERGGWGGDDDDEGGDGDGKGRGGRGGYRGDDDDDDVDDDGTRGERRKGQRRRRGGENANDDDDDDAVLNEYGRFRPGACRTRRRVERTGMMDVWVPLYHPSTARVAAAGGRGRNDRNGEDGTGAETSGMVHLLISYEPNGMSPKRGDVVAFESFARRPLDNVRDDNAPSSSLSTRVANAGPIINPVVPPLTPLLVVDARGRYLLLEYVTSRTVTCVDRGGNVKSTRWERAHRVRVHRNAVFVVERQTFVDGLVDVARLPGDIVLSTSLGREIAEVTAPVVAGVMELMGPAILWGRLIVSAGGMGLRAGIAGAQAATEAVVSASQEKALERRSEERIGVGGVYATDAGVYKYIG
ncbi:hypothetical protein ACHAXA_008436 [Cyclostephanos tholiformis]|uniref:Uncharacterized protein n=1 Tax=Cyclostephanos tholiformis TaxID=382380 RepID=A0ABD3SC27_9STRA